MYLRPLGLFTFSAVCFLCAEDKRVRLYLTEQSMRRQRLYRLLSKINADDSQGFNERLLWGVAMITGIICFTLGIVLFLISVTG
jgi:hypothetical protein